MIIGNVSPEITLCPTGEETELAAGKLRSFRIDLKNIERREEYITQKVWYAEVFS